MPQGFQVWDEQGRLVFDSNEHKVLREVASFVITDSGSFDAAAWQAAQNKIIAAATDTSINESPISFVYTGNIKVAAARADTTRPLNATVRVQLF